MAAKSPFPHNILASLSKPSQKRGDTESLVLSVLSNLIKIEASKKEMNEREDLRSVPSKLEAFLKKIMMCLHCTMKKIVTLKI